MAALFNFQPRPAGASEPDGQACVIDSGRIAELITGNIPEIILVANPHGQVIYASRPYYDYTGSSPANGSPHGWMGRVHPEDKAKIRARWRAAISIGESIEAEFRLRDASDRHKWFRGRGIPIRDHVGALEGWLGVFIDIDEFKQTQAALRLSETALRESLERQSRNHRRTRALQSGLAKNTRMNDIRHVASTLAHELNQPMTAAALYASAVQRALGDEGALDIAGARIAAANAVEQAQLAGEIIRSLRTLFTNGKPKQRRVDLRAVLEDAIGIALAGVPEDKVAVRVELGTEPLMVDINPVQIQQVLMNLVRNALEAMETTRSPELRIESRRQQSEALVSVSDNGIGISPALAERLFNPFVSDKHEGMGVGLSISRSIIEAHGGRIWFARKQIEGAAFRFTLPVAADEGGDVQ